MSADIGSLAGEPFLGGDLQFLVNTSLLTLRKTAITWPYYVVSTIAKCHFTFYSSQVGESNVINKNHARQNGRLLQTYTGKT